MPGSLSIRANGCVLPPLPGFSILSAGGFPRPDFTQPNVSACGGNRALPRGSDDLWRGQAR